MLIAETRFKAIMDTNDHADYFTELDRAKEIHQEANEVVKEAFNSIKNDCWYVECSLNPKIYRVGVEVYIKSQVL